MTQDSIEGHEINVGPVSIVRIGKFRLAMFTRQIASDDSISLVSVPSTTVINLAPHPTTTTESDQEAEPKRTPGLGVSFDSWSPSVEDLTNPDLDPIEVTDPRKVEESPEVVFKTDPHEVVIKTDPNDKTKSSKQAESRKREAVDKPSASKKKI